MTAVSTFGKLRMGRKKAADVRDKDYAATKILPNLAPLEVRPRAEVRGLNASSWLPEYADLPRQYRHHKRSPLFPLDQDGWSACVGYAFGALVLAGPVMQPRELLRVVAKTGSYSDLDAFLRYYWYREAQEIDEWPGSETVDPKYYGTSMRAGAKIGQRLGFWPNYWWLNSLEEVVRYLVLHGPVPIGVDWFTGCFQVDKRGFLQLTGEWEGGHAMLVDSVNISQRYVGGPQSWGKTPYARWKLHFDDFGYLLRSGGDALAIPEVRLPKVTP